MDAGHLSLMVGQHFAQPFTFLHAPMDEHEFTDDILFTVVSVRHACIILSTCHDAIHTDSAS